MRGSSAKRRPEPVRVGKDQGLTFDVSMSKGYSCSPRIQENEKGEHSSRSAVCPLQRSLHLLRHIALEACQHPPFPSR